MLHDSKLISKKVLEHGVTIKSYFSHIITFPFLILSYRYYFYKEKKITFSGNYYQQHLPRNISILINPALHKMPAALFKDKSGINIKYACYVTLKTLLYLSSF